MARSLYTSALSVEHLQTSACEAAQCRMWDLPPTFLRPVIFSAVGRCCGSSGLNRASIHSLTCVREVEAALSNGCCACEKDPTHQALLPVTAQEGLLRNLTQGRMRGGGSVAGKDRDQSFLMSSLVHACVFTVNSSGCNAPASKLEGKRQLWTKISFFSNPVSGATNCSLWPCTLGSPLTA